MPRKKIPKCCVCGLDAHDAYEMDNKIYCEDCLWEVLKEMNKDLHDETITTYTVDGLRIKDDVNEAIRRACDYLNIKYKKIY